MVSTEPSLRKQLMALGEAYRTTPLDVSTKKPSATLALCRWLSTESA